jgi:hypothetical protein
MNLEEFNDGIEMGDMSSFGFDPVPAAKNMSQMFSDPLHLEDGAMDFGFGNFDSDFGGFGDSDFMAPLSSAGLPPLGSIPGMGSSDMGEAFANPFSQHSAPPGAATSAPVFVAGEGGITGGTRGNVLLLCCIFWYCILLVAVIVTIILCAIILYLCFQIDDHILSLKLTLSVPRNPPPPPLPPQIGLY